MNTLFSFKMDDIMHVLLAAFLLILVTLTFLAVRNRLLLKLALRNIPRRRAQSVLIICGLMLSTLIITSAFAAGDTFSYSIRSSAVRSLGPVDETVTRATVRGKVDLGSSQAVAYFPSTVADRLRASLRSNHAVDGVMPVIAQSAPLRDLTSRQTKDAATLLGAPASYPAAFGTLTASSGSRVQLDQLGPNEAFINDLAAQALNARPGDRIELFVGAQRVTIRVRDVVRSEGLAAGGLTSNNLQSGPEVLLPLGRVQALTGHPAQVTAVLVSNRGDDLTGAALTGKVVPAVRASINGLPSSYGRFDVHTVKQDALDLANRAGTEFTSGFIAFGLFSIAAGVMLVFLIFVMLAAERRAEMGMARAIGTKRRHLIQQFLFEGYVYDLGAALVGVVLGLAVGLGIVSVLASLVNSSGFFSLQRHIEPRSVVVAFCLGAIVTFITVVISSWRVSRLTIVAAIRDLPDDLQSERSVRAAFQRPWADLTTAGRRLRRGRVLPAASGLATAVWHLLTAFRVFISRGPILLAVGYPLALFGASVKQAFPFMLGVSLVLVGVAMMVRWIMGGLGIPDRIRNRIGYTLAGVALTVYWLLPFDTFRSDLQLGIEMFVLSGIMLTLGGVWTVMYNVDLLLSGLLLVTGGIGRLTPILKTAVTYPMQHRFRTGMTLFMFSLVVFALVVQSVLIGSFSGRNLNLNRDFGGYAAYGSIDPSNPIQDITGQIAANPALRGRITGVGGIGKIPVGLAQPGNASRPGKGGWAPFPGNILDDNYLSSTRFTLHSRAVGYSSDSQVWRSIRDHPGYAVVDSALVKVNGVNNGGSFKLSGFAYQDTSFKPVRLTMRDERNGRIIPLTVIGVFDSSAFTFGVYTGQSTLRSAGDAPPASTTYYFRLAPGHNVHQTALALGSAFLANGLDMQETQAVFDRNQSLSVGFNNLLEAFMALGLAVGIAALGVIATRSVVERRQQIGMLRAIGFKRRMVQATFLLESSFVAILGTLIGVALGLVLGMNVIAYFAKTNSNLHLIIPWSEVGLIVAGAYVASLLTTYLPAWQASRVDPADALRYE